MSYINRLKKGVAAKWGDTPEGHLANDLMLVVFPQVPTKIRHVKNPTIIKWLLENPDTKAYWKEQGLDLPMLGRLMGKLGIKSQRTSQHGVFFRYVTVAKAELTITEQAMISRLIEADHKATYGGLNNKFGKPSIWATIAVWATLIVVILAGLWYSTDAIGAEQRGYTAGYDICTQRGSSLGELRSSLAVADTLYDIGKEADSPRLILAAANHYLIVICSWASEGRDNAIEGYISSLLWLDSQ